ncbi:Transcription factor [Abeliophyllum distichum]|uniref:Transcription factor n=1 Tax=Abeliophyllum distichum TaxID=126358 RepID=A0ABD1QKP6_9LAMI
MTSLIFSYLFRLQTLVNPEALRLAATLLASNPEIPQLEEKPIIECSATQPDGKLRSINQILLILHWIKTNLMQSVQGTSYAASEKIGTDWLENSSLNSVLSTLLSSPTTPLNSSSSTYIHGSNEDENCSDFLKFEMNENKLVVNEN